MEPRALVLRSDGRTLIETLVTTFIMTIVVGLTATLFAAGSRVFSRENTSVTLQNDITAVKNVVLDDLSIAGYRPDSVLGPFLDPIDTSGATDQLTFIGDVDSDGQAEKICYAVASGELQRTIQDDAQGCGTGPTETLATDVQTFDVLFFDDVRAAMTDAAVRATPQNVRHVQVNVGVASIAKGGPVTKTISGEVAIRN